MWTQTLWNFVCFIVFYQSLSNLIESRNKVIYETVYDRLSDENYLSICLKIEPKDFDCANLKGENSSEITDKLVVCNKIRSYFDYVSNDHKKSPYQIFKKYEELNMSSLFEFDIDVTEMSRYLNSKHFCFSYKLNVDLANLNKKSNRSFFLIKIFNRFHLTSKYFLHGKSIPRFYGRVESLTCRNFEKCSYFLVTVRQFQNKLLPAPFETNCVNNSDQKYSFKKFESIDVKSACIMENLKRKYRLYAFFYTKNDKEMLDYKLRRTSIDWKDVANAKAICKSECKELLFTFLEIENNDDDFVGVWISKQKFNNIAIPLLSVTNFWIYFFALICLFFKISFLSLIFKANNLIKVHMNESTKQSVLTIFLWTGLVSSFFFGYFILTIMYRNYIDRSFTNYVYREIPFRPAEFNAAICKILNLSDIEKLSLFEIENQTPNILSKEDYLLILFDEEKKVKKFNFKMFFKKSKTRLEQCYLFEVLITELRYRSLLSMTSLLINSSEFDFIYLNGFNKTVTTIDQDLNQISNIVRFEDYDVANCTNYTSVEHNCDSRQNCIDKCVLDEFLTFHRKLPFSNNIFVDDFEDYEKKSLYFDFNVQTNQTIIEKCEKKYQPKDCKSTSFLSNYNGLNNSIANVNRKEFKINLFLEQVKRGNAFNFSIFKLIFGFLLLYTSLIGLSFPKICNFSIYLINFLLKDDDKLSPKNWIFLFSLIGSTVHTYYLARETFHSSPYANIDLQLNYLNANQKIPNLLFCIKHNIHFRPNEYVNGHLLDQKTAHLNESYLFKEITYYNLNASKKVWNSSITETTENFEIDYFFLLNYKCLEIKYRMNFNHIKNGNILTILKIKFNKNIEHKNYLFTCKLNGTDDFSDYYWLKFDENSRIYFSYLNVIYYNRYQKLISPKLLFTKGYRINDVTDFMDELKRQFKINFNFSTKMIPLTKPYFDLQINDQLFEQFNSQFLDKKTDESNYDYNYERTFFFTKKYSSYSLDKNSEGTLSIDKVYYTFYLSLINRSEFLENLLNVIFLWFNFYISELIHLISSFASFFLIFRLQNIKKLIFKIRQTIDHFFVERTKIYLAPIDSLNNTIIKETNKEV